MCGLSLAPLFVSFLLLFLRKTKVAYIKKKILPSFSRGSCQLQRDIFYKADMYNKVTSFRTPHAERQRKRFTTKWLYTCYIVPSLPCFFVLFCFPCTLDDVYIKFGPFYSSSGREVVGLVTAKQILNSIYQKV